MARLFLCALALFSLESQAQPAAPPAASAENSDPLAQVDELYRHRDDPRSTDKADALLAQLLAQRPGDFEVLWRASRAAFWKSDGMPEKTAERAKVAKEAWQLAEKAIKAQPQRIEGHYYAGLSVGSYAIGVGIFRGLREGLEPKFQRHLDAAIKTNLEFENRGALLARARAYAVMPWPKRDLPKAEVMMTQIVERHPVNLRAWLFLAELQLKRENPTQARASLEKVLKGSEEYDPPEARRVKGWAGAVKSQIDKELQ